MNTEVVKKEEGVPANSTGLKELLDNLFMSGNECLTVPNGAFPLKEDTRSLLALFSDGRFLVLDKAKFDGRVLSFEVLARRRQLPIEPAKYVDENTLKAIYVYASKVQKEVITDTKVKEDFEQARMQKDFVTIISQAALQHVSDIHVVVGDKTTVFFRANGLMQLELEYNKDWGESFVRAAFASADISDASYAQNEYQSAQKLGTTPLRGSQGKLRLPRNVLGIRLQFNPIAFGTRYLIMRIKAA